MVSKRIIDTDILSHFFRANPIVLKHTFDYLNHHDTLSISSITYYELLRGMRYKNAIRQLKELENFAGDNEIVPLNANALDHAANIYVQLRHDGNLINEADILIAGIALAQNAVLVTNNSSHFSRIKGLTVENWLTST